MPDDGEGPRFSVLDRIDQIGSQELGRRYGYPVGLRSCWVRGNMIASVDGGATSGGRSGGLGGDGDRALFPVLRELADVIVVGASTVRVENYSGVQFNAEQRQERRRRGQADVAPIAVVTRSGCLDRDANLFHRTEVAPLILTCADAIASTTASLGALAEVLDASGAEPDCVDLRVALDLLADRGLLRVLTEGGPAVLGMFVEENLLDEICLTVAPALVGGASSRIVTGPGEVHTAMQLTQGLTDDEGYLYLRYLRRDPPRSRAAPRRG